MSALALVQPLASRICRKCGQERDASEFPGAHRQCRACRTEGTRAWAAATGYSWAAASRRREEANKAKHLHATAKRRAAARGIPFDITPADIFVPLHCPVLGVELVPGGRMSPNTATLDRIVPELGYVRGNVAVISWRANCLKRDATAEELEHVAAWMRANGASKGLKPCPR